MRNSLAIAALDLPVPPTDVLARLTAPEQTEQRVGTYTTYTIQSGDTLGSIASRFGVSASTLLWNNNELSDQSDYLRVGAEITIPTADGLIYTVKLGDSLNKIASIYGIDPSVISSFAANSIGSDGVVRNGAILLLPGAKPLQSDPGSGTGTLALAGSSSLAETPTPRALATPAATGPSYDGSLWVGASVQVSQGGCLNARSSPGGDINTCIPAGSVTEVVDGPVYANGFWWWQLSGQGWSVDTYLAVYNGSSAPTQGPARPATSYGFIWPTSGSISDGFGIPRGGGSYHNGIDISNPGVHSRPVAASADGRVVLAQVGYGGGLGNHVIIAHDNGLESVYAHMSALTVSVGQYVSQGDLVGYTGCTGYCLGEHLHFEIRSGGVPINPLNYLP